MPLTVRVSFNARFRAGNRLQIPMLIRWQHKLGAEQVLRVRVKIADALGAAQEFHGRMRPDGRLNIPRLTVEILCRNYELKNLVGQILEVSVEPAEV